ncbi:MAG: hypothetical protein V7K27_26460 [Nostoc sp.]|uniref:hypothetical protein n=1 Tax=Nostoc sp. TaxID=1180 RepID=UPI002FF46BA7
MLPEIPEPILLTQIFAKLTSLGRIHPISTGVEPRKFAEVLSQQTRLIASLLTPNSPTPHSLLPTSYEHYTYRYNRTP